MANNNVKAPPYPKTKYTDAKFRDIIPTLPLAECLKIEYRAKGVWFKMISKHAINRYNCECCGIDNVGPTPILDHLRGKKHRLALQVAEKLYHPQYTVAKPTKSPGRTPILDALTEKDKSLDKSKSKPGPLSSKTKPGPATSKPAAAASANAQKSNTDKSNQKPGPDKPNQKPGPASSKKPANAAVSHNKAAAPTKTATENAAAKPANGGDSKPSADTTKANDAKASSTEKPNDAGNAASDAKANENKTNDAKPDDGKVSDEKSSETKAGEEKAAADTAVNKNEVKQDESKSGNGAKPDDTEVTVVKEFSNEVPEIVILDDDDDDVPASNQSKAKEPELEIQGKAIPVANTAVPKNQRPPKRGTQPQPQPFPIQQPPAVQIPPADCVINPAAVLAQSGGSGDAANDENEKPRYQQNRVIVPSNSRKRGQESSSSSNQNKKSSEPNFSKKTFSTKVDAVSDTEGIIGVEYVVKILKVYNDPEPFYECCLCEVVMDGTGMQSHLLGYNHRYKYLEKHFPTVFNQHKDHMGNIQVMSFIFERLAKAIEAHHGRELPYECLSGEFRSNRHGVMTTVYSFRHASEYSGPSFTNVIDKKEVDDLYQKRLVYNPPKPDPKRKPTFDTRVSVGAGAPPAAKRGRVEPERPTRNISGRGRGYRQEPEQNLPVDDATHKLMVEEFLNHTRGKSRSPPSRGGRGRRHRSRSRSRSPHRSSHRRRSVSPLREGDIWQAYRHLVDRSKTELDQMYREYRKDPEKHPNYNEEWRKFWKHRKDQLTREGLDHRNYDFQPEWVRYFAVRIEELYEEAVEDIKISARRRLILPMTNDELKDKKYHVKVESETPTEPEHDHHRERPEADQHRSDNQQQFAMREEKTSVVSVLRLLTALEDYLGSLGPKMVDLLSRALLVEKTNPGEVNEIILNLENCTTLETAMEKLKGVLIAGLLEGPKVKAFNNVITETDKILRLAYKMRRDNPQVAAAQKMAQQRQELSQQQPMITPPGSQNTMGPGGAAGAGAAANLLSQIDKKELATKLAAALTAQGKTDFNPEQLQQLIAVYSLIDKKKRDTAAATDKQKMTLSDTLTALLNPKGSGGDGGGNFSNMSNPVNNSSISNFVSMLNNRDGNSPMGGGGKGGDSEMWQNLQNIQSTLRLQNNPVTNANVGGGGAGGGMAVGGFGNNPGNSGRGFGNANQMGGGGGSNFNRGGGFGGGGGGGGDNRGGYPNMDSLEAGFRSGYQGGVNNSNPTRGGGDDMISGGRGVNDMMGGGQRGADMISRGRVGPGPGGNAGGNSFNQRMGPTGTGANNTLGFSRNSYLGGGAAPNSNYNFPGLSNFSTSISAAPLNSGFSRMGGGNNNNQMGSGGGGAGGGGNNMGGGNFNRNANTNFGSGQNQRNNSNPGRGSNWKNQ